MTPPTRRALRHLAAGGFASAALTCFIVPAQDLEDPRFTFYCAGWAFALLFTLVAAVRSNR